MPLLLLLYPHGTPDLLAHISRAVVFFNALSGSMAYTRMGRIDYQSGTLFALATLPGAILGALTTAYLPRRLFDVVLGGLLITGAGSCSAAGCRPRGSRHRRSMPSRESWLTRRALGTSTRTIPSWALA
jgi:uncharacterized membrane protein YfcA